MLPCRAGLDVIGVVHGRSSRTAVRHIRRLGVTCLPNPPSRRYPTAGHSGRGDGMTAKQKISREALARCGRACESALQLEAKYFAAGDLEQTAYWADSAERWAVEAREWAMTA